MNLRGVLSRGIYCNLPIQKFSLEGVIKEFGGFETSNFIYLPPLNSIQGKLKILSSC